MRGEMREVRDETVANATHGKIKSFKDLMVFNRSYDISIELHKITLGFPKYEQYGGVADQIRRASKSIGVNIAEGYAKRTLSIAEFKRFLMIAFGSAEEMRVWAQYGKDLGYLNAEQAARYEKEYDEIAKMIYALHKKWTE